MKRTVLRLIAIVFCALAFAASDARADILELLKTHKIVVGEACKLPCALPKMNPRSEIRLANDVIAYVYLDSKLGFIFPVNREQDVLNHPLMAGYFRRQSLTYHYFKTQSAVAGNTLKLIRTHSFSKPPINNLDEDRIDVSGNSCVVSRNETFNIRSTINHHKYHAPCEIVPLENAAAGAEEKFRTLTFVDVNNRGLGKTSHYFKQINDRLYLQVLDCVDLAKLSVEFDWRGGSQQGAHECLSPYQKGGYNRLTYTSVVKVAGKNREMKATGIRESAYTPPQKTSFEIEIHFVLDGDKCHVEKFYKREKSITYGNLAPEIDSSDAQSTCYLD